MSTLKQPGQPYMRQYSNNIRLLSKNSYKVVKEDSIMNCKDKLTRTILVLMCRSRQRQLQGAWNRWLVNAQCAHIHDYKKDMMAIMSRPIDEDEKRTELEVEVILKWVSQTYDLDATGVQHTIFMCNSKDSIVDAIQHARVERYQHPEHIVLQDQAAGAGEGLYTILKGKVDILMFSPDSVHLVRLATAKKSKLDDEISQILKFGTRVAQLGHNAGFGELSAIANVRRGASVCASKGIDESATTDVFVVAKDSINDLLSKQFSNAPAKEGEEKVQSGGSAEVMDYLRQSGLAHKTAITDLLQAAACFKKVSCGSGTLLYRKGDPVDKIFIVLRGEFLLNIGDYSESKNHTGLPFQSLEHTKCYILRRGSILGDEGMIGKQKVYQSSAVSLAEDNVIFEVSGFGLSFLAKRFGLEKYSALAMKEQSPANDDFKTVVNSEIMVHSAFTCLRKCIASQNPSRGFQHSRLLLNKAVKDDDDDVSLSSSLLPPLPQSPISRKQSSWSTSKQPSFSSLKKKKSSKNLSAIMKKSMKSTGHFALHDSTGSVSSHDYSRLPQAAMHHTRSIVKQVRQRELYVLRDEARSHVEKAAKELELAKKGKKEEESISEKNQNSILEQKYQRAVEIYKTSISEKLSQSIYDDICLEDTTSETESTLDKEASFTVSDLSAGGLTSFLSYDDIEEDESCSADEDELISMGLNPKSTKTEQYLFYLNHKKNTRTGKRGSVTRPSVIHRLESVEGSVLNSSSRDLEDKSSISSSHWRGSFDSDDSHGHSNMTSSAIPFQSNSNPRSIEASSRVKNKCSDSGDTVSNAQPQSPSKNLGRRRSVESSSTSRSVTNASSSSIPFQNAPPKKQNRLRSAEATSPSRSVTNPPSTSIPFQNVPPQKQNRLRSAEATSPSRSVTNPPSTSIPFQNVPPQKQNRLRSAEATSPSRSVTNSSSTSIPFQSAPQKQNRLRSAEATSPSRAVTIATSSSVKNRHRSAEHISSKKESGRNRAPCTEKVSSKKEPPNTEKSTQSRPVKRSKRSSMDSSYFNRVKMVVPQTRLASAGATPKLTADALKELGKEPVNFFKARPISDSQPKKEKDGFIRLNTIHTLGVETIMVTDKEGHTRRIIAKHHLKPLLAGGPLASMQVFDTDSSIESDLSFRKNNPKILNEIAPIYSIEKLFGIEPTNTTSEKIGHDHKRKGAEHLWTTRYMKSSNSSVPDSTKLKLTGTSDDDFDSHKSDSDISYSRSVVMKARQDLAANLAKPLCTHTDKEKDAALLRIRRENEEEAAPPSKLKTQWHVIALNPLAAVAEHKVIEEKKGDVLHSFHKLMQVEHQQASFSDGRKKNMANSEFRFNRDVDKLNSVDEIKSLSTVNQPSKDLLLWKKFCSDRVVSVNKGSELKQTPVRSKSGFHTIYWGKILIDKSNAN